MRSRTRPALAVLLTLTSAAIAFSCSDRFAVCEETRTCYAETSAGAAGDGDAGGSDSGGTGNDSGTTAPGSAGDAGAGSGGEAGGAALPCDGACPTDKPVCLTATDTCVQCDSEDDCTGADKTRCDAATNTCVQCTETTDCTSPDAARCDAGTCAECETNADCAHITGRLQVRQIR